MSQATAPPGHGAMARSSREPRDLLGERGASAYLFSVSRPDKYLWITLDSSV